jgi:hypothetical protein
MEAFDDRWLKKRKQKKETKEKKRKKKLDKKIGAGRRKMIEHTRRA